MLFHLGRFVDEANHSWSEIANEVDRRSIRAVGFDVYDTLLTREINDDQLFKQILARRLVECGAWPNPEADYLNARAAASTKVAGENLVDWYRHDELAEADAERCIAEELTLEASLTVAIDGAAEALETLRSTGVKIGFVSDMHLPGSFISQLLCCHNLRVRDEALLVSGDVGCWKGDGRLFELWLEREDLVGAGSAYVGNDRYIDQAVPTSLGIEAIGRSNANPNRYERAMAAGGPAGAVVASAATRARLNLNEAGDDTAVTVGTGVVGQSMMAFLLALRARCLAEGIDQIGFVARDGELLMKMAEAMPADYWNGFRFRYVEGNRLTWTLAGADSLGVDRWLEIGTNDQYSFLRHALAHSTGPKLLRRLGIDQADLDEDDPVQRTLLDDEPPTMEAWDQFLQADTTHKLVAERGAERAALVAAYISTLDLEPGPLAIVDVGWRGQTAAVVAGVFEASLGTRPLNYHFGGYGVRSSIDAACWIERYAFDDSRDPVPFASIDQCVEMFTGTGERRAVGYTWTDTGAVPVYDEGSDEMWSSDRDRIWDAALELAATIPAAEKLDDWSITEPPDPAAAIEPLKLFWTKPTAAEGRLGERLRLEVDDDGSHTVAMSAPYGLAELRTHRPRRWRQGSLAISSPAARTVLPAVRRVGSAVRRS